MNRAAAPVPDRTGLPLARRRLLGAALLGAAAGSGAAPRNIVLGQVASLSGPNGADLGQGLQLGIRAALARANDSGGIGGRRVALVSLDDRYEPAETVRLTQALIDTHRPAVLLGYRGTANTLALVRSRILETSGVPLVGTLTGAAELQGALGIWHLRTSYPREIALLVRQLAGLGLVRLGLFHASDAFGQSGRAALLQAAHEAGVQLVAEAAYGGPDAGADGGVAQAVQRLADAQPHAVVMVAVGEPVYAFVQALRARSPGVRLFSLSVVSPAALIARVGLQAARGIGFSQVFPYPFSDAAPLSRAYRAALRQLDPDAAPGYFSLEGYVYAQVVLDVLRAVPGEPTPAAVQAALARYAPRDLGGFAVRFDPATRNGAQHADLTVIGADGRLVK